MLLLLCGGGGGRLIRRGRVLAIVADAVNVIKTFFCLIITLPTAPVGVAQSTQTVHLPPIIPKQTLSPLSPVRFRPFLPARLGHCIIDQMHFVCLDILLMHARSSRTTTNARWASLETPILLHHPPPVALSVCPLNLFENYACLGNARKPGNGRRLTMANG